jgi:hypothetical protein
MSALVPPANPPLDVCKRCVFFSAADGTCVRSVAGFSERGQVIHGYAKFVRMDPKQCGPSAAHFKARTP